MFRESEEFSIIHTKNNNFIVYKIIMNESIDLSIDLNIDNYDLADLLSLFKLDYN